MKQKKALTMVCVSMLSVSVLAGCGAGNDNQNSMASTKPAETQQPAGAKKFASMELEVAVFQGGYGREFWDAAAASFMKEYPGTKINITASPKIAEVIRPKVVAGNPPDFLYISGGDNKSLIDSLVKDNGLLDISSVFNDNALDEAVPLKEKILPGILESRAMAPYEDGKIYMAPYNYGVMGLWYNKTLFDKKGIKTPKTWDEFFALNSVAKENGRALFTYQGMSPGYLEDIVIPSLKNVGGDKVLKQYFEFDPELWKTDAAKQVFGVLGRIANEDNALMKGTVALNHTQSQTEFMQGKAMFITNGSWFEGEMKDAPREEGFEFGFLGVPAFKSGDPMTALSTVEQMMIPAKAKNPELAKEFMKYLYTKPVVKMNGEKAEAVMAVKGAADLVKEYISPSTYNVFKSVDQGIVAVNGSFKTLAKGSKYKPNPAIYGPMASVMNKQMTVEGYTQKVQETFTDIQKEFKENKE